MRLQYLGVTANSVSDEEAQTYLSEVLRALYRNALGPYPLAVVTDLLRASEFGVEFIDSMERPSIWGPIVSSSETGLTYWSQGGASGSIIVPSSGTSDDGFKHQECFSLGFDWDGSASPRFLSISHQGPTSVLLSVGDQDWARINDLLGSAI